MPALDALHAKITFEEDADTPTMNLLVAAYIQSLAKSEGLTKRPFEKHGEDASTVIRLWKSALSVSEIFYVHPKMSSVITAASESLPSEPLLPQDLPSPKGFVLIPDGLSTIDVRGSVVQTNAVLWSVVGGEVVVNLLTDKYDPVDRDRMRGEGFSDSSIEHIPRYTLSHMTGIALGKPLPTTVGPDMLIPPEYGVQLQYLKNEDGTTNVRLASDKGFTSEEMEEMFSFGFRPDPTMRWLVTMWRLMQQPLTTIEDEYPNRQMRRALERRNRPEKKVSVVRLRREAGRPSEDASEVSWSHRWLVRGHWRKQWYGSGENRVQRAIWVHPHVKGPEDAPFLVRDHVYSLER